MIRVAIIEDVVLTRQRLIRKLARYADIGVVGEAGDTRSGLAMLAATEPDLLFLDVTLPDGEGPDLLRALPSDKRPLLVFLTARADHSLAAFELQAIDYLLKPVGDDELGRAIARAREVLRGRETYLSIPNGRRTDIVAIADIDFVEIAGHYACLHIGSAVHLLREPITKLATRLKAHGFARCHRSALVRLTAITRVEARTNGDGRLLLASGRSVRLSRTYRAAIEAALRSV